MRHILLLEASTVKVVRVLRGESLVHLLLSKPLLGEVRHTTAADALRRLIEVAETVLHPAALEASG